MPTRLKPSRPWDSERPERAPGAVHPASTIAARAWSARYLPGEGAMNENFSLIVMCLFLLGSLAFLAQQLTSYH